MPPLSALEVETPWYVRAFDRTWLKIHPHRGDEEAERHADAILALVGLGVGGRPALSPVERGRRILDVACGAGRYARAFAKRGLSVTGVDLSEDLLALARLMSPMLPGMPTYMRWDARDLPFDRQFEGAVSMFTSMGYFEDVEDDRRILRGVRRALVPGGRFLLDYLNAPEVRANLVESGESVEGGLRVLVTRRILQGGRDGVPGGARVVKSVRVVDPSSGKDVASFEERVRLYDPDEIDAMLAEAGLVPEGPRHGDLEGSPWTAQSKRLVRVSSRPRTRT